MKSFGAQGINQGGFAGRGFFGPLPAKVPSFTITGIGNVVSTGPWAGAPLAAGGGGTGFAQGHNNGGFGNVASLTPALAKINGQTIETIGWQDQQPSAGHFVFMVVLNAVVPQNFFNALKAGAPWNATYATAGATFFNSNATWPGFTGWFWQDDAKGLIAESGVWFGSTIPIFIS